MDEILKEHFIWDKMFDERYHCNYCSYDTQLANAAVRHFEKKHKGLIEVIDQPEPEPEPEPEQVDENLETEEQ